MKFFIDYVIRVPTHVQQRLRMIEAESEDEAVATLETQLRDELPDLQHLCVRGVYSRNHPPLNSCEWASLTKAETPFKSVLTALEKIEFYTEGVRAFEAGKEFYESPYPHAADGTCSEADYEKGYEWRRGWNDASLGSLK